MARILIPYATTDGQTARVAEVIAEVVLKRIAKDKPGHPGLDTSRDHVYTEGDAVRRFAEHVVQSLELNPA